MDQDHREAGVALALDHLASPVERDHGVADAVETPPATRPGGYQFDRTISREVLENYLSRSITIEGMFNGRGDLDDNIRMLKSVGVKYAGRSLCLWGAENSFLANLERARE